MNKAETAEALFRRGANCAQAVLGAFDRECGLAPETAARLASGFGGGMGRMREVCGAVSAMFMVAGLRYGSADPADKAAKDAQYALIRQLAERFRKRHGSIICRELLGAAGRDDGPVAAARTVEYYRKRPCAKIVAEAAALLEELDAERSAQSLH